MNVAFYLADQNPHRDRSLGITNITEGLIHELLQREEVDVSAIHSRSSYRPDEKLSSEKVIPFRTDQAIGRLAADHFHPFFAKLPCDLWHYPKGFLPAFLRYKQPVVGTVCDVILQFYADRYPAERSRLAYEFWLAVLKRSIPRFDAILTISEFSRQAIYGFCERYRLKCPPIIVTYPGCRWDAEPAPETEKGDFVIHFASDQPHKQTERLIEFWSEVEGRKKSFLKLDLIGQTPKIDRVISRWSRTMSRSGRLSNAAIKARTGSARALIISSEIEGFGLPAIEAYALGTPVVYVKDTAVEEILGRGTPGGFSLESVDSFSAALDEVLQLSPAHIRSKSEELRSRFSWSRCADQTLAAYRQVL